MYLPCNGFLSRLNTAGERMSELEGFSIKVTRNEKQREQRWKKQNKISKDFATIAKGVTYMQWENQNEKKEKNKRSIWNSSD